MSGIGLFTTPDALVPRGSERSQWWVMLPQNAAGSGNSYKNARGLIGASDVIPAINSGSAGSYNVEMHAGAPVRVHRGNTSGSPCYFVYGAGTTLDWLPARMSTQQPGAPFSEVFIFRECFYRAAGGPLPPGYTLAHGFSLIGNLNAGFPLLGAGSWRGIGIVERASGVFLAIKNANPATTIALPGLSLTSPVVIEHRLYAPAAGRVGRYELHINDELRQVVQGDAANFPLPALTTEGYKPMAFALDNALPATQIEVRTLWGEIIMGPDSPGTF